MRFKRESAIIAFIISVLIIAGVWNFFHVPFKNEILQVDLEKQLTVKKAINIINFKNKHGNLENYMAEIEERQLAAHKSLPENLEQGEFINFIQQKALENQAQIISITPGTVKSFSDDSTRENSEIQLNLKNETLQGLVMLPIRVKIECGYFKLLDFLKAIETSERTMQIKNVSIVSSKGGSRLTCELNILIFAYKN